MIQIIDLMQNYDENNIKELLNSENKSSANFHLDFLKDLYNELKKNCIESEEYLTTIS